MWIDVPSFARLDLGLRLGVDDIAPRGLFVDDARCRFTLDVPDLLGMLHFMTSV